MDSSLLSQGPLIKTNWHHTRAKKWRWEFGRSASLRVNEIKIKSRLRSMSLRCLAKSNFCTANSRTAKNASSQNRGIFVILSTKITNFISIRKVFTSSTRRQPHASTDDYLSQNALRRRVMRRFLFVPGADEFSSFAGIEKAISCLGYKRSDILYFTCH